MLACSSRGEAPTGSTDTPSPAPPGSPVGVDDGADAGAGSNPAGSVAAAYPAEVESLELRRSIAVRFAPSGESKNLGTVARNTRVGVRGATTGEGCAERWIAIEPRGWVCEEFLRQSDKPPSGVELPRLGRAQLVPGIYGKVAKRGAMVYRKKGEQLSEVRRLAGSVTVRKYDEITVAAAVMNAAVKLPDIPDPDPAGDDDSVAELPTEPQLLWRIGKGEYVNAANLREHEPSSFRGVRLGDDTGLELPIGFVVATKNVNHRVSSYRTATGGAAVRRLAPRSAVAILETARNGDRAVAYRIGEREWVRAGEVRVADKSAPPPRTEPGERWVDVDRDQQLLVAYEGELAVYATLISSGSRKWQTPTGIYRIWVKFSETDMSGQMADDESYSVATVPWTQFYAKDFALHTSYWHDKFGVRRSHGCVNLAPVDARFLYFWSQPDVPPGWSMSHGVVEYPGSMVRIRSKADPDPDFQGYAKRVDELRK